MLLPRLQQRRREDSATQGSGARQECHVTDETEWYQRLTSSNRTGMPCILDFAHTADHLSQLLETLEQTGMC